MLYSFLDIIFPQYSCCLCRKSGRFGSRRPWCDECMHKLKDLQSSYPICDKCGKYLEEKGGLCQDCRHEMPEFSICRAVGPYKEANRVAIKVLKFFGKKNVSYTMGSMMAETVKNEARFFPLDVIIPVPASYRSLVQRGFSQTFILASQIGKLLRLQTDGGILYRERDNNPAQRELTREERSKNLLGAFVVRDPAKISQKNVLLVDDVYTTGATVKECTKVLLEAGAARVTVITWSTGIGF